jgi:hypothetical protein
VIAPQGLRAGRPSQTARRWPAPAAVRLMRLELRHNAMPWLLPLAIALFGVITYRKMLAMPPLWYVRATSTQSGMVLDFIMPVAGAAAWMGSREARRRVADLLETVARPRRARLLAVWAATSCWAVGGCLLCLAAAYWATSQRASWGGPLWWPAVVAVASMPAFAALGLGAGVLVPSRFTAPVVTIAAFFVMVLSTELIVGSQSYWQISPIVSAPWDVGADHGVATFYPYLPDLSIAQLMFLAGLTVAVVAAVAGLPRVSGPRRLRVAAAVAATAGLLTAGTAVDLAGTGMLDAHGMIAIPALHDAADDRPLQFTPVCSRTAIPVCLNPAYEADLPAAASALGPVLSEIAGLPDAPVRIIQSGATYLQGPGNQVAISLTGPVVSGRPPVYRLLLPDQLGGPQLSPAQLSAVLRSATGPAVIASVVGDGPGASAAQRAVAAALLLAAGVPHKALAAGTASGVVAQGTPVNRSVPSRHHRLPGAGRGSIPAAVLAAALRFKALPVAARHAWLVRNLGALRAGRIALARLP